MNHPHLLGCFSFFVFVLAVFGLEGIICMHLYLLPDDFLQHVNSIMSNAGRRI
jgi:hypothetical protein